MEAVAPGASDSAEAPSVDDAGQAITGAAPIVTRAGRSPVPRLLWQALITIICGALFALILQVTMQNYVVQGDSMWPSVQSGDRVLVNRLAYRVGSPRLGDVVVFRFPYSWEQENLIKRIIGVPGDTVEIRPGTVLVNGRAIHEPYVRDLEQYWYGPSVVPSGEYFVLGDNREVNGHEISYDSHQWGFLPARDIYGRVMITYWPVTDFHLFGF